VIPEILGMILSRFFSFFLSLEQDNWLLLLQKLLALLLRQHAAKEVSQVLL